MAAYVANPTAPATPPIATYDNYTVKVWTVGDSTTTGVGAATLPAWRSVVYNAFTTRIKMVGSQSYGGDPDILGVNASHEGHNGQTIQQLIDGSIVPLTEIYRPDVVTMLAGINDVEQGASSATVLSRMSTALDELWTRRSVWWMQILLCPPIKPLDSHDTTVQAVMAGIPAMIAAKSYTARITYLSGVYDAAGVDGMNDEHHPNDTGYTRIGAVIATALDTIVTAARPSTPSIA